MAGCVFAGEPKPNIAWKAAAYLGDCSYALYLVHPIALGIPHQARMNFVVHSYAFSYFLLIIAVAVAVAIAVHLFFEAPVTTFLRDRLRWATPKILVGAKIEAGQSLVQPSTLDQR